ncbi:MAG: endonuclease [Okeania sp. SIO2F4]|uniref:endonuclease/exonuclease/phosphatase family protein n=1 Tax=Okeania sp. SIO2F4 TaxID=2607790 RepID=UPI00142CF8DF|nr:endonuclease/exonuclease/phosphatase family protein [Okeania sp. SIO2F4]NES01415.1 endonuclease [Okeania sp. SIO2F4]
MTTLFVENFETDGNGTRYTTSIPEFSDGAGDFFTRTNGSNIGSFYQVLNPEGSFYFAAQDIDGEGAASEQTLTFSGIDIAGFTNLNFSTLLAEDDDGSNQDWDLPDFVLFEYQIDGGGFTNLLAIESIPDDDEFNAVPAQDTDFDGNGDGTEVTDTFSSFSSAISGTGSTLDLRITFDLDSRDEDIAIDNIEITGESGSGGTTPLISEFQPNPIGTDPALTTFELSGTPGDSFDGVIVSIESDSGSSAGIVDRVASVSGTFDANGLLTVDIPDLENPSFTVALLSDFTGNTSTDIDTDNDGVADDLSTFGTVFDAIGVPDTTGDEAFLYGTDLGGTDFTFTGDEPRLIFRDGSVGDLYAINDPDNGQVFDVNGTDVTPAIFDTDPTIGTDTFGTINPTVGDGGNNGGGGEPTLTPIYDIQGASHTSALEGQAVTTTGIVTAVDSNGFYLQDPTGDSDDATSDGIFVFTGSAPGVSVGDELQVDGTVSEFTPGGTSTRNLSTTQISSPTITNLSSGNALPDAVIIGSGGRVPPTENIDDDAFASFDPTTDGIDFFESLEGMRVTAQNVVATAPKNRFGEIFTVVDNGVGATGISDRGTLNISPNDFNPEKIQIDEDTGILPGFNLPQVDVGSQLGDVTGVVSYDFGNFQIQPTQSFTASSSTIQAEVTNITPGNEQLTVASYNVLNLDPNDSDGDTDVANGRFDTIASQIINNLNTPDVIGLQEVQDNTGSLDDGTIAADQTLQTLVDAIAAAGGPTYEFIDNTFITDGASGGQPGGNIRTAFLYNPDRVDLVDDSVQTIGDQNPGSAFDGARLPLVADFEFNGQEVSVVSNHFSSKGGSAPILGIEQPFDARQEDVTVNGSLDERQAQANAVQGFVADALTADPNANLVVLGDFNEFEFVSPLDTLEQNLTNLTETLPENERYSFIFQGNSQSLDHILVSDSLDEGAEFDIVHVNSEFAETNQRASDHDPLIVSLNLPTPGEVIEGTRRRDNLIGTDGDDTITGFQRRDTLTGGGGNDTFVYTSLRDGRDTITDFEVGSDKIDLSQVLSVVGFEGVDPIADGYVGFRSRPGNTILTIDPDGTAGHGRPRSLLLVQDVDAVALNNPDNFIF